MSVSVSVSVSVLSRPVYREATTDFTVDARPLSRRGGDHVRSEVTGPGGEVTECVVKDNADGTYGVEYTPYEEGRSPYRNGPGSR